MERSGEKGTGGGAEAGWQWEKGKRQVMGADSGVCTDNQNINFNCQMSKKHNMRIFLLKITKIIFLIQIIVLEKMQFLYDLLFFFYKFALKNS